MTRSKNTPPPAPLRREDLAEPPEIDSAIWDLGGVSVSAAAAFLGCSRKYVYDLMREGSLPWGRLGRARRIPRPALTALLAGKSKAESGHEI